jgi:chromosome segregation ATPase
MNMPAFSEEDRPSWMIGIAAVVLGAVFTFIITNYFNENKDASDRNSYVSARLNEDQIAIETLKITMANLSASEVKMEASLATIESSQASLQSTLQILKDDNDSEVAARSAIKEQLNAINTRLGSIDDILRPPRVLPR